MYIKNGKGYRIAFDYEKLHEFFNRNNFLEVENYEPPVVVFDGYEYTILFKSKEGLFKHLTLSTPEISKDENIERVVSFIENEIFKKCEL